jgi:hypothetical protein
MITITTPDGINHWVSSEGGEPDFEGYSSSPNTRAALQAAYDAGQWEPYTPPEPEPPPPTPNWQDFRLALMVHTGFRDWAATLPADWREDLKACAILANEEALQGTYNHLVNFYPPPPEAAAEWQQIAAANHISVVFDA